VREELITRNVAQLVELPACEPSVIVPWSPTEALAFLQAAIDDPLYPAFVPLLLYGLRRGEVLGLRWQDIDLEAQIIHARQQIHRSQGQLRIGPVKTRAGSRDLPLISLMARPLPSGSTGVLTARRALRRPGPGGSGARRY
jgi:integrase